MNSSAGLIAPPQEHSGLDELREHLGADQAHQFPLGIKGHEAVIVISFIDRIRTRIGEITHLDDVIELGDLIQGFIDVLRNYESSVDQMSYHVIENHQKHSIQHIQKFCIRFLENLWGRVEAIASKMKPYPELEKRWEKDLEEIGGGIGALIISFEELINDTGFDWREARQIFDTTIKRVSRIELFVDRFIELQIAKNTRATIEKARSSASQIFQKKEERESESISGQRVKRSRKARVRDYLFKSGENTSLLVDPERVRKRLEQLGRFYALFQIEKDELINIALDTAVKHDLLWLRKHISLLSNGEGDETLRQEVEATLYYRREVLGISPRELTPREEEDIILFTEKGTLRLSPPFREHHGILYGHTLIGGQKTKCKCTLDALRYGKPFSIEYLDREKTRWKQALITPLFAWKEPTQAPKAPPEGEKITTTPPSMQTNDGHGETTENRGDTPPPGLREDITPELTPIEKKEEEKGTQSLLSRSVSWIKKLWTR